MAEIKNNSEIQAISDLSSFGSISKDEAKSVLDNQNIKVFLKSEPIPKSSSQRLRDLSDCCGVDEGSF